MLSESVRVKTNNNDGGGGDWRARQTRETQEPHIKDKQAKREQIN